MNTGIVARATNNALGFLKEATTLEEARIAYYRFPKRETIFGMVAMAHWGGFALGISTTMLGLCGDADFPSEELKLIALKSYAESILHESKSRDVSYEAEIICLLTLATEEDPAQLDEEQMACVASFLSFAAPPGGEAELFLCDKFPDTITLLPILNKKLKERLEFEEDPWKIITTQNGVINFLKLKIASLEKAKH